MAHSIVGCSLHLENFVKIKTINWNGKKILMKVPHNLWVPLATDSTIRIRFCSAALATYGLAAGRRAGRCLEPCRIRAPTSASQLEVSPPKPWTQYFGDAAFDSNLKNTLQSVCRIVFPSSVGMCAIKMERIRHGRAGGRPPEDLESGEKIASDSGSTSLFFPELFTP